MVRLRYIMHSKFSQIIPIGIIFVFCYHRLCTPNFDSEIYIIFINSQFIFFIIPAFLFYYLSRNQNFSNLLYSNIRSQKPMRNYTITNIIIAFGLSTFVVLCYFYLAGFVITKLYIYYFFTLYLFTLLIYEFLTLLIMNLHIYFKKFSFALGIVYTIIILSQFILIWRGKILFDLRLDVIYFLFKGSVVLFFINVLLIISLLIIVKKRNIRYV